MMVLSQDIDHLLSQYSDFSNDKNIEFFLDVIDDIARSKRKSSIPVLIKFLDDNSDYSWIMQAIVDVIESFEPEDYIPELMVNIRDFTPNSVEFLKSLLFHILNSERHCQVMKDFINLAPKDDIKKVLFEMMTESPDHGDLILKMIDEISKNDD